MPIYNVILCLFLYKTFSEGNLGEGEVKHSGDEVCWLR